ncbi:MAG TPA: 2-hydroxyacyl-CoA dehydratase family protein [Candidatus Eremiobacteraeota bacterium]|nr:MAG: Benzoyl-CoA reductase subunit C [bacterium ADurb.Bin363]HPZ08561.1 2-hydroxyacyl-CoA dehydratase family protein [Candidatus Eremiobacteraeota bacterium]
MAYFCCHVPVELISAAGLIPYRLNGLGDFADKSYSYFPGNFCMFARNCLNEGLTLNPGRFAGVIFINSCDAMERLYDVWKSYIPLSFIHLLSVPRKNDVSALAYFLKELLLLKVALERFIEYEITEEKLKESILLYNISRHLLREINLLRKEEDFYLPSSQLMEIILNYPSPLQLNIKLKEILDKKDNFYKGKKKLPALMLSGSVMEDMTLIKIIEEAKARVIYEDFCFLRTFNKFVESNKPSLEALAEGYITQFPCARRADSYKERLNYIRKIITDYSIKGIIFYIIKFCDIFSWETHMIASELRSEKIPVLIIEGDYPVKSRGQIKSRIEAFIEMLEEDK